MLGVGSSVLLLFSACAMFYQADVRRGSLIVLRQSKSARIAARCLAVGLMVAALIMLSGVSGLERGVPFWFGIFSITFVVGLFLSAQRSEWHLPAMITSFAIGVITAIGSVFV